MRFRLFTKPPFTLRRRRLRRGFVCVLLLCSSFLAAGTTSLAAPALDRAGSAFGSVGKTLIDLGAGAAIGAVTGGVAGAAAGANIDWHNRQLHPKELQWIERHAQDFAEANGISVEQARTRLAVAAAKNLDALWALQLDDGEDTAAAAYLTNAAEAGAEQTPLTFLNQDGKQQPLFRAQGDDYWRPDRYAQEALSYSKSHDRFPGHNLRGNITRSVWQGVTDQASETGRALGEQIISTGGAVGEQIISAPWGTVKAVGGAIKNETWEIMKDPFGTAGNLGKGVWNLGKGVWNFGKEVLRLGKDAAFNLGSGTTSAWAGYRGAENPLNELYGQNMGPALLSLGSAQGVLTAAQAIPMMKGAQALGKGALKSGVKGVGKLGGEAADIAVGSVVTKRGNKLWTNSTTFQGTKVYQLNDLIDPKLVDGRGRTNLDRMQKGLAPIGPDGKSINLHHMTQRQSGTISEMKQTFDQKNRKTIHINPNSTPSGIDRGAFNKWRSDYWKSRANDFNER